MCDAELQVCEDALHAVESLLPGGSQVFLHGPGHRGKNSLSRLPRIHHLPRVFGGRGELLFMEALDVREGLLHRHDQPGGSLQTRGYFSTFFIMIGGVFKYPSEALLRVVRN